MLSKFLYDRGGNFAVMTAIAILPIMGGLALAVDFTQMSRQKQVTMNALDAAGIATGRRIMEGATDAQLVLYAQDFFKANLNGVDPANTALTVVLPADNDVGGGTLKLSAALTYKPYFLSAFTSLLGKNAVNQLAFQVSSEIRLKNTLEVTLVLDNSGSMNDLGTGSGKTRMALLKDASKQLVDTIAEQAAQMKQVEKPVQFGVVPFAASVNVGSDNADQAWMDTTGISPIHHENFAWSTLSSSAFPKEYAQKVGSVWYARGTDWGMQKDKPLTRFTIYDKMQRVVSKKWVPNVVCIAKNSKGKCTKTEDQGDFDYSYGSVAAWGGMRGIAALSL